MNEVGDKIVAHHGSVVISPWKVEPYTDDRLVLYTYGASYLYDFEWVEYNWFEEEKWTDKWI